MFVLENANHSRGLTLLNLVTMPCENWKPISPVQDLGDTAVGDAKLSRDDARSDAGGGHLDDLEADVVGQRAPVDEHPAQLVDAPLACEEGIS